MTAARKMDSDVQEMTRRKKRRKQASGKEKRRMRQGKKEDMAQIVGNVLHQIVSPIQRAKELAMAGGSRTTNKIK